MTIHMHRKLIKIILLNYLLPEEDFCYNIHFQNDFQKPTIDIFPRPNFFIMPTTFL